MAKLIALRTIIRRNDDKTLETISPMTVFDSIPAQAKQLIDLGSARQARDEEIAASNEEKVRANGGVPLTTKAVVKSEPGETEDSSTPPGSGADGDPNNRPKGRSK